MRAVSAVNDELEVGFDEKFEIGWSRAEHVGRIVMFVLVLVGIAGGSGAGPLDHARVGNLQTGAIDYQPITRWATATQLTLHLPPSVKDAKDVVTISSGFIEPLGLQSIDPQPIAERAVDGNVQLTLAVVGGGLGSMIRLHGKPSQVGPIPLTVTMQGHEFHFTTFVVP